MSQPVIRKWEAMVARSDLVGWFETFRARVLDQMRSIFGFRTVAVQGGHPCRVPMATTWDGIHQFVGEDPCRAVLPDVMKPFFCDHHDRATFHNVLLQEAAE